MRLFAKLYDPGAGVGGVAQAGANVLDTQLTNQTNLEMQNRANAFNANQAQLSRDFTDYQDRRQMTFQNQQVQQQENFQNQQRLATQDYNTQMSDTAIQRRAADLKTAGFNPLLSVAQLGGASSPTSSPMSGASASGASGSSATAGAVSPPYRQTQTGLGGAMQALANLKLTSAQTANVAQDTKNKFEQTRYSQGQADIMDMDTTTDQLMARNQALMAHYEAQYGIEPQLAIQAVRTSSLIDQQVQMERAGVAGQILQNNWTMIKTNIDRMNSQVQAALLNQLIQTQTAQMKQAGNNADQLRAIQSGTLGKSIMYLQQLSAPISSGAQAAGAAAKFFVP